MSEPRCGTCKAFLAFDGEAHGSCQLHPPVHIGEGTFCFPGVNPQAWCLDWQEQLKPTYEARTARVKELETAKGPI